MDDKPRQENTKPEEVNPVSHIESPIGVTLTIITLIGFVIYLINIPELTPPKKWLFGFVAYFVAALACVAAWGLIDSIVRFIAHLLWAAIFALNLFIVLAICVDAFGALNSIEELDGSHWREAGKQLAFLFAADLVVALVLLPLARITKVEPI